MLVTDLIMERSYPWTSLYDPSRKATHGISDFNKDQANTLSQYRDWLTGGEVDATHEIAAGQGAIWRERTKKLAVYPAGDRKLPPH